MSIQIVTIFLELGVAVQVDQDWSLPHRRLVSRCYLAAVGPTTTMEGRAVRVISIAMISLPTFQFHFNYFEARARDGSGFQESWLHAFSLQQVRFCFAAPTWARTEDVRVIRNYFLDFNKSR